jgi:hypothetical protein
MGLSGDVIKGPEIAIEGEDDGNNGTLWYAQADTLNIIENILQSNDEAFGFSMTFITNLSQTVFYGNTVKVIIENINKVSSKLLGTNVFLVDTLTKTTSSLYGAGVGAKFIETITLISSYLIGTSSYIIDSISKVPSESIIDPIYKIDNLTPSTDIQNMQHTFKAETIGIIATDNQLSNDTNTFKAESFPIIATDIQRSDDTNTYKGDNSTGNNAGTLRITQSVTITNT